MTFLRASDQEVEESHVVQSILYSRKVSIVKRLEPTNDEPYYFQGRYRITLLPLFLRALDKNLRMSCYISNAIARNGDALNRGL